MIKKIRSLIDIIQLFRLQGILRGMNILNSIKTKKKVIEFKYKDELLYINAEKISLFNVINGVKGLDAYVQKISNIIGNKNVDVVFDVGANCGFFSYFVKKMYPNAKIYLFEASPELTEIIKLNMKNFKDCEIINKAVSSSSNEKVTFYINPEDQQTNSMNAESVRPYCETQIEKLDIDAVGLDDFCNERNINSIDLMKVDIQGSENKLLKGAENIIKKIEYSVFELSFFDLNSNPYNILQSLTELNNVYEKQQVLGPVLMGADILFYSPKK
jgi:FkbM family methyltransferase